MSNVPYFLLLFDHLLKHLLSHHSQVWVPFIWLYSTDANTWPECCWMQVLISTQWSVPVLHWLTSFYTIAYNVSHLTVSVASKFSPYCALFVTKDVKSGQSPLMHAVESGNADMVHFLIEVMRMCRHWGKTCDSAQFNVYAFSVHVICCIITYTGIKNYLCKYILISLFFSHHSI